MKIADILRTHQRDTNEHIRLLKAELDKVIEMTKCFGWHDVIYDDFKALKEKNHKLKI